MWSCHRVRGTSRIHEHTHTRPTAHTYMHSYINIYTLEPSLLRRNNRHRNEFDSLLCVSPISLAFVFALANPRRARSSNSDKEPGQWKTIIAEQYNYIIYQLYIIYVYRICRTHVRMCLCCCRITLNYLSAWLAAKKESTFMSKRTRTLSLLLSMRRIRSIPMQENQYTISSSRLCLWPRTNKRCNRSCSRYWSTFDAWIGSHMQKNCRQPRHSSAQLHFNDLIHCHRQDILRIPARNCSTLWDEKKWNAENRLRAIRLCACVFSVDDSTKNKIIFIDAAAHDFRMYVRTLYSDPSIASTHANTIIYTFTCVCVCVYVLGKLIWICVCVSVLAAEEEFSTNINSTPNGNVRGNGNGNEVSRRTHTTVTGPVL